jgi:type I restriction enzyme S subunit
MTLCEGSPISEIENEFRGTAGQSNISLEQCRKFKFPIPAKEEQQEVVLRVEKLFTLADSLEAKYKLAMQRIERIEQAVLAKAFRGELAAQDPNDEPADVLLQRILAEKEKQVGLKANKNGKTKNYKVQDQPGKIAAEESATYKKRRK